jgi:hypothetical protein
MCSTVAILRRIVGIQVPTGNDGLKLRSANPDHSKTSGHKWNECASPLDFDGTGATHLPGYLHALDRLYGRVPGVMEEEPIQYGV